MIKHFQQQLNLYLGMLDRVNSEDLWEILVKKENMPR